MNERRTWESEGVDIEHIIRNQSQEETPDVSMPRANMTSKSSIDTQVEEMVSGYDLSYIKDEKEKKALLESLAREIRSKLLSDRFDKKIKQHDQDIRDLKDRLGRVDIEIEAKLALTPPEKLEQEKRLHDYYVSLQALYDSFLKKGIDFVKKGEDKEAFLYSLAEKASHLDYHLSIYMASTVVALDKFNSMEGGVKHLSMETYREILRESFDGVEDFLLPEVPSSKQEDFMATVINLAATLYEEEKDDNLLPSQALTKAMRLRLLSLRLSK